MAHAQGMAPSPQDGTKFLGVSQPVSTAMPDEADIRQTELLHDCLKSFNLFETPEELQERIEVLRQLNMLVRNWIQSESKNVYDNEECVGKLFTFGSYRLGVHNRGADIDSLCVAPRHIDRKMFFTTFYDLLKADANVTELHAVEDAFVPVIKLRYKSVELDILFARLALKTIPDDLTLCDDMLLRNLDDKSIRSLNGSRVADEILKAVPNQETFAMFLRAIKHWATNRGIYSNVLGFLGGISWAILVARTCQLYPNAVPSKLVQKFFYVFSQWEWPNPVFLKDIDVSRQQDIPSLQEMVWDPRIRFPDRLHLMPIITPAFPEQNSTPNVTTSAKAIILKEMKTGLVTCNKIYMGHLPWSKLFEEIRFFARYKHFITLMCYAANEEDQLVFRSFVESKIRILVGLLERNDAVNLAHINPKQFKPNPNAKIDVGYDDPVLTLWFIGLEFDLQLVKNVDLSNETSHFMQILTKAQQVSNRGQYNDYMGVRPQYLPRKNLEQYISVEDIGFQPVRKTSTVSNPASTDSPSSVKAAADCEETPTTPLEKKTPSMVEIASCDSIGSESSSESTGADSPETSGTPSDKSLKRKIEEVSAFSAKRLNQGASLSASPVV